MKAHFFDIDTLIRMDNRVWIISNKKPSIPLIRITMSEYNLIKKGVYKNHEERIDIGKENLWLPKNLMDELMIKCRKMKCDITDLSFSMQEFINPDIIQNLDYEVLTYNFRHLKNKPDEIYIIMSKNNKMNYEHILNSLREEMLKLGLKPSGAYYLNETFFDRNKDEESYKKVKIALQHIVGYKCDGDKFIEEEIDGFDEVYFYDDDRETLNMLNQINEMLFNISENSEESIRMKIKDKIRNKNLIINEVTHNQARPLITSYVTIIMNYINKTFESFRYNHLRK